MTTRTGRIVTDIIDEECDELRAPRGLEGSLLELAGEEHVLLSYALPDLQIPFELTPTEREIVRGVFRGEPMAAIARARGRSVNTVRNQLRSVYAKLGVGNRMELIRRCSAALHDERFGIRNAEPAAGPRRSSLG